MVLHLVRHACAGKKGEWLGPDEERPLDPAGRRQALALEAALTEAPVGALLSSPARRCVQTLEPLAAGRALDVERTSELGPDVGPHDLLAYLSSPALDNAVLCTHGEVMQGLLPLLRAAGTAIAPQRASDEELLAKGTLWRLQIDPGTARVLRLDHVRPSPEAECQVHRGKARTPSEA